MSNKELIDRLKRVNMKLREYEETLFGELDIQQKHKLRSTLSSLEDAIHALHILHPPEGSGSRKCPHCGKSI